MEKEQTTTEVNAEETVNTEVNAEETVNTEAKEPKKGKEKKAVKAEKKSLITGCMM